MAYNTGNPVGSADPRDLYDNAQNLDEAVNSDASEFDDRRGKRRLTIQGMVDAATTGNPAVGAAQDALESANRSSLEADRAALGSSAALTSGWVYSSATEGQSARVAGDYFWVAAGGDEYALALWRAGSSAATDTGKRLASSALPMTAEPIEFEQGSITLNGNSTTSDTRVRTPKEEDASYISVHVASDQDVAAFLYDNAGTYLDWTGWQASIDLLRVDGRYRLAVRKKDDTPITPAESSASARIDRWTTNTRKLSTRIDEDFTNSIYNLITEADVDLEQGGFNLTGTELDSSERVRSVDYIAAYSLTVVPAAGFWVNLYIYDENFQFISTTGNLISGVEDFLVDGYVRLSFRTPDSDAIMPEDVQYTATIKQRKWAYVNEAAVPDLPASPSNLPEARLWSDALSVKVTRDYPPIYGLPQEMGASHQSVYAFMDQLVADFGEYVFKEQIGLSELGSPMYMYRFKPDVYKGTYADETIAIPKIILTAGVHGDISEKLAVKSSLIYMDELCRNWREYPHMEAIRWGCEILFIPVANPDGYDANTRNNYNDVNINRDFPALTQSESVALDSVYSANLDAVANIDHHNYPPAVGGVPAGYAIWLGADSNVEIGISSEVARQMMVYLRKTFAAADDTSATPVSRIRPQVATTTTDYTSNYLGIDSILLETPNTLYTIGEDATIWAREALARLLNVIYEREMRLRVNGESGPWITSA